MARKKMVLAEERLEDMCELITDGTHQSPTTFEVGPYLYLTSKNVRPGRLDLTDVSYVGTDVHAEIHGACPVRQGDVLLVKDGVNTGMAAINTLDEPFSLLSSVALIRSRTDVLDAGYLVHWLNSPGARRAILRQMSGSAIRRLVLREIRSLTVPVAPVNEQRRIAAILDQADGLRSKRRVTLERLRDLKTAIFDEVFVRRASDWPIESLEDVVKDGTIVTYGIVQAGDEYPGGVPYIRTGDIVEGAIRAGRLRHTNPMIAKKFDRSRVEAGEVVMSIRATVGTTALVPPALHGANLTQGTARISPGAKTDSTYLLHWLRSSRVQSWISRQVKGATFREITLARLRKLPVAIPPLDRQKEFGRWIRTLDGIERAQRQSLQLLDALFAALQDRSFRGEL